MEMIPRTQIPVPARQEKSASGSSSGMSASGTVTPFLTEGAALIPDKFTRHLERMIEQVLSRKRVTRQSPQPLVLDSTLQNRLRSLLGLSVSSPFSVEVLDTQGNGELEAGDVVIISGGITGVEISRHVLTRRDIQLLRA